MACAAATRPGRRCGRCSVEAGGRLTWDPDGKRLASAGHDGTLRLWDAESGQALHVLQTEAKWVYGPAFSPDGRYVAAAARASVRIWDAGSGELFREVRERGGEIHALAFSPGGHNPRAIGRLATGGNDKTVRLWDYVNGLEVLTMPPEPGAICALAFSPVGRRLAVSNDKGPVHVWEAPPVTADGK